MLDRRPNETVCSWLERCGARRGWMCLNPAWTRVTVLRNENGRIVIGEDVPDEPRWATYWLPRDGAEELWRFLEAQDRQAEETLRRIKERFAATK